MRSPLDSYDARRENAERYDAEQRDEQAERDEAERERWSLEDRGAYWNDD